MSLGSQQQGLFIVVSRKRERSPSSEREDSPLLAPPTPPATDKRRIVDDEEVDWDAEMRELGNRHVSKSVQEPAKTSRHQLWWAHDNSLLVVDQDSDCSSNFNEDCSSHVQFTSSTIDLSSEDSHNISTRSGLLALSREDLEAIANAATPVTPSLIVSGKTLDLKCVIAQEDRENGGLQLEDPEDEGSSNFPGDSKHHHSVDEKSVGSAPQL